MNFIPIWAGEVGSREAKPGIGVISRVQALPVVRVITLKVFAQERGSDFFRLFVG